MGGVRAGKRAQDTGHANLGGMEGRQVDPRIPLDARHRLFGDHGALAGHLGDRAGDEAPINLEQGLRLLHEAVPGETGVPLIRRVAQGAERPRPQSAGCVFPQAESGGDLIGGEEADPRHLFGETERVVLRDREGPFPVACEHPARLCLAQAQRAERFDAHGWGSPGVRRRARHSG
jgi:hypothetical protein